MSFGFEVRINRLWDDTRIARAKEQAIQGLGREAKRPVEEIAPHIQESRREEPSGDWWYQVTVTIRD